MSRKKGEVSVSISPLDLSTLKRVKIDYAGRIKDYDDPESERAQRCVSAADKLMSYALKLKFDHPHIRGVPIPPLPEVRVKKIEADILMQARALEESDY